jgi:hypothetical protein
MKVKPEVEVIRRIYEVRLRFTVPDYGLCEEHKEFAMDAMNYVNLADEAELLSYSEQEIELPCYE